MGSLRNYVVRVELETRHNEAAFLEFYRQHQGAVFRFALHMSGQMETAEEIVQEVFLAFLANGFVSQNGNVEGYLIGTARNILRNRFRQTRKFVDGEPSTAGSEIVDALSKEQELQELRAAILSLPPNYREAVVLCDLEGMDYSQAASNLNCPVGTVRSRLHRARAILAAKMKKRIGCTA